MTFGVAEAVWARTVGTCNDDWIGIRTMFRGVLVLLARSMRVDGRRLRSYLLRQLLVGLVFGFLVWAHVTAIAFGAPGLRFAEAVMLLNFVLITLAGVSFFATAITEEKEERTLGLLRMAGVNPVAVLLGKSTTRLIGVLLLFWSQLPFVMLATTLGGVTVHQIVAAFAALMAYVVLLANLALLVSVCSNRSGAASAAVAVLLAFIFLVPPAISHVVGTLARRGYLGQDGVITRSLEKLAEWMTDASVYDRLRVIFVTGFSESPVSFQFISNVAAGCVLFGIAWAIFDRFTQEADSQQPERRWLAGSGSRRSRLGSGRAWSAALVWKDYHFLVGGHRAFFVRLIVYGALTATIFTISSLNLWLMRLQEMAQAILSVLLVAMGIELSVTASRVFHDEVQWGTLSGLMLLPMSRLRIAYAKVAGCLLLLVPGVAALSVCCCLSTDASRMVVEAAVRPASWLVLVQFIVFLHVTAILSLVVRWGALPLALALLAVVESCSAPFFVIPVAMLGAGTGSQLLSTGPLIYTGVIVAGILQYLIGLRLVAAAAE